MDSKQTVRQTQWGHMYAEGCQVCTLRTICGGMFDRGDGYDPAELYPVFVDRDRIVSQIIHDGTDPSYADRTLDDWREEFEARLKDAQGGPPEGDYDDGGPQAPEIGFVTEDSMRLFSKKRRAESKMAARKGVAMENTEVALGEKRSQEAW